MECAFKVTLVMIVPLIVFLFILLGPAVMCTLQGLQLIGVLSAGVYLSMCGYFFNR